MNHALPDTQLATLESAAKTPPPRGRTDRRHRFIFPAILAGAVLVAYGNTLQNPFIFDDTAFLHEAMVGGDTYARPFSSRRWIVDLTFQLNWMADGLNPRGYHLVNGLIHLAASLVLYGLVFRVTRAMRTTRDSASGSFTWVDPAWLAFAVSIVWATHPLCTQAITYVIQRHESLMSLFYLLTLYGVTRTAEAQAEGRRAGAAGWCAVAAVSCALGMNAKEVMITAPFVAFFLDRLTWGETLLRTLYRRWWLHGLLFATLLLIPAAGLSEVLDHKASAGFGLSIITWWQYLLTQGGVILWYLRLAILPWPLVLDYGWLPAVIGGYRPDAATWAGILAPVAVVAALLLISLAGLALNRVWGFLGFAFFAVLSVSSSVIPIADVAVEHRMYLPLAAVVALAVLGLVALLARTDPAIRGRLAAAVFAGVAVVFATLTLIRNAEYRTAVSLWTTVVERAPENPRGWHNLGEAYASAGDPVTAIGMYERAIDLVPSFADARHNLGQAWLDLGRPIDAEAQFREAVRYAPADAESRVGLAGALIGQGRFGEAEAEAREALRLDPTHARAHNNLGVALGKQGRGDEAIAEFRAAIAEDDALLDAYRNLVGELLRAGRVAEAADVAEENVAAAERAGADPTTIAAIRAGAAELRGRAPGE